jgi:hypothetical protein
MALDALSEAERRLVTAVAAGEIWRGQGDRWIRASVIRSLALTEPLPGEGRASPVHAKGIRIDGATIAGPLDLQSGVTAVPLSLFDCEFDEIVIVRDAELKSLGLRGCRLQDLDAHGVRVHGPLLLSRSDSNPFRCPGRIDLTGAHIGGELSLSGAEIGGEGPIALDANGAAIGASLSLRRMKATGLTDLTRVTIAGNLHAQGARFDHPGNEKVVLIARGAKIGGDVFLRNGFAATGLVDFTRAEIQGGMLCDGATFETPGGTALSVNQARIGAALQLSQATASSEPRGRLRGHLDLRGAKAGEFRDDASLWPDGRTGNLKIDGFEYERFGGRSTIISGRRRVRWLKLQRKFDLRRNFKAQPWKQLIKTLRAMGHTNEARLVAIAKERALHVSGTLPWTQWIWSWFSGLLTGYGYLPMRSVYAAIVVWAIGAVIFSSAGRQGFMAPVDPSVLVSKNYAEQRVLPADYPEYHGWLYSLDAFLPVIDLHQEAYWLPTREDGVARKAVEAPIEGEWVLMLRFRERVDELVDCDVAEIWLLIEIVLGWLLTSLAIAGFSGLLRPSQE